ncbi:MAG: FAD/NAD(P)-binding protein [Acidimicrobiia bacterium]|nr:FAD/NAD(P)-binding protein [Acidimicrobiia bacterium]
MAPRRARVVASTPELSDTVTLTIEFVDDTLPTPDPGQFHMLWAPGIGEVPISVSAIEGGQLLYTIRSVGAVTAALCAAEVGTDIGIRGPYGTSWGLEAATGRDVMVVAGGIGLAPLRPAIRALLDDRDSFGRLTLLVGARSPDDLLFFDEIREWRERSDVEVGVTVDTAGPGWHGDVGVVTRLVARAPVEPLETVALVCGPEVMIRYTAETLLDRGVDSRNLRVSMERNMHCAIGHCGHCQFGASFICKDGPVFDYDVVATAMRIPEL